MFGQSTGLSPPPTIRTLCLAKSIVESDSRVVLKRLLDEAGREVFGEHAREACDVLTDICPSPA
jgi:hypothetical protein